MIANLFFFFANLIFLIEEKILLNITKYTNDYHLPRNYDVKRDNFKEHK